MDTYKVICGTDACQNKDVVIEVVTDATQFMCGACGEFITNIAKVSDGPAEKTV